MSQTPEQKKEAARQRKANQRAREAGLPLPYPPSVKAAFTQTATEDEREVFEKKHADAFEWATEHDATGQFYKSENRSLKVLLGIYHGKNVLSQEEDETEKIDKATGKKKKENRANPSLQKISIRNTETKIDGLRFLIDPNSGVQYRTSFEVDEVVCFERWLDLRDKARKDLFWLGRLLGKGLYHSVHQDVCDMFVQKNFDGKYFDGFNIDDFHEMINEQKRFGIDGVTECREMILLDPRGAYKSTIDGIDAVQWLINCPDVRIMIITAFKPLASKFMKEIKGYFYLPARGEPTPFQLLFPEFVLTGVDGRSKEPIECPARHFTQKEPNLWVTSMESSSTGMHCDVRKADDVVDPKNSNSEELREELKFKFDGTDDLLDQWGFSDVIGTRYFTNDWYGTRMAPDENGEVAPYAYHCRGCWTVKEGFKNVPLKQLKEEMVTLLFPAKLSWTSLKRTLTKKGERSFRNQQLNEATDPTEDSNFTVHFDKDTLIANTLRASELPPSGEIVVAIDWAYSDNRTSDFSVLVAARIHKREDGTYELHILEVQFDKWKSTDLALQIVLFLRKWNPSRSIVEKANGADLLQGYVAANAKKYGCEQVLQTISWMTPSNAPDAKRNRVKDLELLLNDGRFKIVSGGWIDETYKQLVNFTGEMKRGRKDDIPDAMGYAALMLPRSTMLLSKTTPEEQRAIIEEERQRAQAKAQYDRYFGNRMSTPRQTVEIPVEPEAPPDPRQQFINRVLPPGMRA